MNEFGVGTILHDMREKKHISAKKLSNGLCSASMLSRIEKGERKPDKFLFNALIERMGESPDQYNLFGTRLEAESEKFDKEYLAACRVDDRKKIKEYLKRSERLRDTEHRLQRQMAYIEKAMAEKDLNKKLRLFGEGLSCTIEYVKEKKISDLLLSYREFMLYNSIACVYYDMKEFQKSSEIWEALLMYSEQHIANRRVKAHYQAGVLDNLSNYYFLSEQYYKMMYYVEKGIEEAKICAKSNMIFLFYYKKAYALAKMGQKEEAAKLAPYFYYVCKNSGFDKEIQDLYSEDFKENTGIWFELE
ncbi:MAG: helix-turn-helix domain-containing protein [Lachnospiraceae bacterium]